MTARQPSPTLARGDTPSEVAHIVFSRSLVIQAYIFGETVTALCGATFIPTRDPEALPVCQACQTIRSRPPDS